MNGPGGEQTKGTKEEGGQNLDGDDGGVPSGPARVGPRVFTPDKGHVRGGVLGGGTESEEDVPGFDGEVGEGIEEEPEKRDLRGVVG